MGFLVDISLAQRLNDVRSINKATARSIRTAKRLSALDDVVVACQVILRHTAERAAACNAISVLIRS